MVEVKGHFDVIIIGGGPAGMSAALWCLDLGLRAIVLEKEPEFGGQLLWTFNPIENYLGARAANGVELRDKFLRHVEQRNADRFVQTNVLAFDLERKRVELAGGRWLSAEAIIIATGVRRRTLGVPGEQEFAGRGILPSGAKDKSNVADRNVVIVGGGDAALENALILGETAKTVTVIHRTQKFRARQDFVEQVNRAENIKVVFDRRVLSINGRDIVESVEIENTLDGVRNTISADAVLIRIGVNPDTESFRGQVDFDGQNYIGIDSDCRTSLPDIYAVGDVASPHTKTIASAVGMAATAVKSIIHRRTTDGGLPEI